MSRNACATLVASARPPRYHLAVNDDPQNPANQRASPNAATDPQAMKQFETLINSWAEATMADKDEEANAAAMEVLLQCAEEALRNPTPSVLLHQEADELESKHNWTEAETVRRKILGLDETMENVGILAKAQMDLSGLLRLLGRTEEAAQFASAATASARRADVFPVLVMALECESWCALEQEDSSRALALTSEAVQVIEPGKLFDQMRAKALAHRARCLVACGELPRAELDLAASWELLQAHPATQTLPGPIVALANWWEIKGQIERRQGRLESAQVAMTRAVEYRRKLESPYGLFALARVLNQLGEMLKAVGDGEAADKALAEAKSIRRGLKLPSDF
jgi:tetratricopeptide (TPR) repeat protein